MIACRACPRLVEWRERVATEKRAAYRSEDYWGRPVPAFGDPDPRLLIVGLAPAAHGANRTGRMFTGDRSGDWLFASLHRVGIASSPSSRAIDDGLRLDRTAITAVVRCAPPANRPTAAEANRCRAYLERELTELAGLGVIVALGGLAFDHTLRAAREIGWPVPSPRPSFGHGVEAGLGRSRPTLIGCYHPSQQNTFTGRLTEPMLDEVLRRAATLAIPDHGRSGDPT